MTGDTLWAWQEREASGDWGIISAIVPAVFTAPAPLVTRSEEVARTMFKAIAAAHASASGHPIRLAEFRLHTIYRHSAL